MNTASKIESIQSSLNDRFKQNCKSLSERLPSVYKIIESITETPKLNLDPNTGRLTFIDSEKNRSIYSGDPLQFCINEIKHFFELYEERDYRPDPYLMPLSHLIIPKPFPKTVSTYAKSYLLGEKCSPHYLNGVIFGVGLGYHIEILNNKSLFKHLTIIEKNPLHFIASMYCIDWGGVLDNLAEGQKLSIMLQPTEMSDTIFHDQINWHLSQQFPANANSIMIYNHLNDYQSSEYKDIKEIISSYSNYIRVSYERLGPDCQRLMNANENCRNNKLMIDLNKSRIEKKDTKVAIIGAGPSLDDYIESLSNNRSKFIIVSCGSALASLLKNNITPDFHFELEFLNLATTLLESLNNEYDLSNINLISSYEGNPGYSKLFKNTFQFVQETNELVNNIDPQYILRFGGLTCTNGAAALFTRIAKNDIYFFGLDFAFTNNQHHAKDNITNQKGLTGEMKEFEDFGNQLIKRNDLEVEDVHGETTWTTISFNSARILMERLILLSNNKYFNCSNGAKIEGSIHLTLDELDLNMKKANHASSLTFETATFNSEHIHNISRDIIETSLDTCGQFLSEIKKFYDTSPDSACIRIHNLINTTSDQLTSRMGQNRSIMSFNRLPLLLLFNSINYSPNQYYHEILDSWIEDYEEYITYIKNKLITPFEKNDFYIREEWLDKLT